MQSFICEIFAKTFYPNLALYGDAMMFVCFQGHKYGRRKPTETSVSEFSYLCVNSSLEELIKIKVIFILRQGMFRWQNLQKSVMFFNPHRNFPGRRP